MGELKLCPFCGNKGELHGGWSFWIECADCQCQTEGYVSIEQAMEAWNRCSPLPMDDGEQQ